MTRLLIAVAVLFTLFTAHNVNAAPIDPVDGIIAHSFLDAESDVFVGMMTINGESFGFSFLNDYASLPNNGHTDVLTHTSDTLSFYQNNVLFTASIVKPLFYNAVLSDRFVRVYEDNSTCALFHLTITETNEHATVCLDPTDSPNADNGIVSLTFGSPFAGSDYWQGMITQNEHSYPFKMTQDTIPSTPTVIYLPIIQ